MTLQEWVDYVEKVRGEYNEGALTLEEYFSA